MSMSATEKICSEIPDSSLEVEAREFKPITGGDYRLTMRFVSTPEEKIYGMGQYQQPYLDVKGADLGTGTQKFTGKCSVHAF